LNQEHQKIIERVRKILAKTENAGCTPEESEKAFGLASRIMAEHNLDMSEVEQKGDGEQSWLDEEAYVTGKWTLEGNLAYGIVCRHFFVEGYFTYRWVNSKQKKVLMFFGRPDNAATAKWAFNALIEAFDRLFGEYRPRTGAPASDRRIFISGVASGFSQKIEDERKAMDVERDLVQGRTSGSTALALTGIREQTATAFKEAHAHFYKKDGTVKRSGSSRFTDVTGSASAFAAGQQAGRSLNLNRAIGGSQRRGLAGS
jgi:hypothetical protein